MNRVETKEQVFLCDKFKQKVQFQRAVMLLLRFSPRGQDTFGSPAAITAAFFMFRSFLSFFFYFCHLLTLPGGYIIYGTRGVVASGGQSCICRMSCWVSLEGRKCSFLSTRLYII